MFSSTAVWVLGCLHPIDHFNDLMSASDCLSELKFLLPMACGLTKFAATGTVVLPASLHPLTMYKCRSIDLLLIILFKRTKQIRLLLAFFPSLIPLFFLLRGNMMLLAIFEDFAVRRKTFVGHWVENLHGISESVAYSRDGSLYLCHIRTKILVNFAQFVNGAEVKVMPLRRV